MQPKIKSLNMWPMPVPHPDAIVVSFLAQFDVTVQPSELPSFDGMDLIIGFATNFEYAQLNSINRNQAKQSKHQEWTTWKQWALSHAEFSEFKASFLEAVNKENIHRYQWLNSDEGQAVIARLKTENEAAVAGVLKVAAIAVGSIVTIYIVGFVFNGITSLVASLKSIAAPFGSVKVEPEPQGMDQDRYNWLSRKCIDEQKSQYLSSAQSLNQRDYCKDRDVVIEHLVK